MKKKLSISYLGKLTNQKFPAAYASILTTMEESVITEDYLKECLEVAKAKQDELGFLGNMRSKHPLTKVISEMNSSRHAYLLSLRGSANNALKSPFDDERKAGMVLVAWLEKYHQQLTAPRIYEQHNLVNQLNEDIDKYENIAEAMTTLNIARVFSSIRMITEDIAKTHKQRTRDKNAGNRLARLLRTNALTELKRLMNALDVAITQNSENRAVYVGYWNDIATELDAHNAAAESRKTRKRTAAEKDDKADGAEADGTEADGQMNQMGSMGDMGNDGADNAPKARSTGATATAMRNSVYATAGAKGGMDMAGDVDMDVDMDLQNAKQTNEDLATTSNATMGGGAINSNDVATTADGNLGQPDDAKADDAASGDANSTSTATGNGELTGGDANSASTDGGSTGHEGA